MSHKEKSLVILAAGIGSRFKGGIKQLQSVGPAGECIMDYSIYDALEEGFNRIVFIIGKDIEDLFEELIGNRIRRICQDRGVDVICVFQDKRDLTDGFVCPDDVQSAGELVMPCLVVRAHLTAALWSSMRTITMARMPIAGYPNFWTP